MSLALRLVHSGLRSRRVPAIVHGAVRSYSDGPSIPLKAERNPSHKSVLPLPPSRPPAPIAHTSIDTIEHDYDVRVSKRDGAGHANGGPATSETVIPPAPTLEAVAPLLPPPPPPPVFTETSRPTQQVKRPVGGFRGG